VSVARHQEVIMRPGF